MLTLAGTALLAVLAGCDKANTITGLASTATRTPTTLTTATQTPTPAPAPVTVIVSVYAWDFSPGGPISPPLTLQIGVTYTLIFANVDKPGTVNARHGFSGISELGLPSTDDISAGHDFIIPSFTPQAYQRGAYPFVCTQSSCGGDPEQHAGMIGSLIIQ
jgi:hypothetical protein